MVVGPPLANAWVRAGPVERTALRVISAIRLTALIWRMRPGIVHFFLPEAYLLGGLCALTTRRHHLVMSRRSLNNYQANHRRLAWVERWLHPRMTAILGNSRAVIEQLIRDEGVRANKVQLIYNGIDLSLFERRPAGDIRATLDIDRGRSCLSSLPTSCRTRDTQTCSRRFEGYAPTCQKTGCCYAPVAVLPPTPSWLPAPAKAASPATSGFWASGGTCPT